jgi:predicted kinase
LATLHLISGLPCSGKTTYSRTLAESTGAVLFSLDRWLITCFGRYSIAEVGHDEHVRRVRACRGLILENALELTTRGSDAILDDGFFLRADRAETAALGTAAGARVKIHHLDAPLPELETRLSARNQSLPTYNFFIRSDTLAEFLDLYETPTEGEGGELVRARDVAP